jgi:hypothetical protein
MTSIGDDMMTSGPHHCDVRVTPPRGRERLRRVDLHRPAAGRAAACTRPGAGKNCTSVPGPRAAHPRESDDAAAARADELLRQHPEMPTRR